MYFELCPTNELIAIGTRDGYLRCTNLESQECVFEQRVLDDAAVVAVQFGPDEKVLISGDSLENSTAWQTSN